MRLTPISKLQSAELERWNDLAGRAAEPNPFFEPAFVTAAQRVLADDSAQLLIDEREGSWRGCLPVRIERRLGLPLALSTWRHVYSFLGTPLVDRDDVGGFAAALAHSAAEREHARFTALRGCAAGTVLTAIRKAVAETDGLGVVYETAESRAALQRRPEEDYLEGVKARHRREMKRLRRRLGEELGEAPETHDHSDDPEAPQRFLALEASGWKGREGTAMASDGAAELFTELCREFGQAGRLQLLALEAGGRTAAMKCNIAAGDTIFCFKIAFDEELGHYSPGVMLETDNVEVFHRQRKDERLMDSCAQPDNKMINRLWPDRRSIETLMLGRRGAASAALRLARNAARRGE